MNKLRNTLGSRRIDGVLKWHLIKIMRQSFFYEKVQLLYFQKIYLQIVLNSMHIMDRVLTNGFTQVTVQVNLVLFPLSPLNSHFSFCLGNLHTVTNKYFPKFRLKFLYLNFHFKRIRQFIFLADTAVGISFHFVQYKSQGFLSQTVITVTSGYGYLICFRPPVILHIACSLLWLSTSSDISLL